MKYLLLEYCYGDVTVTLFDDLSEAQKQGDLGADMGYAFQLYEINKLVSSCNTDDGDG